MSIKKISQAFDLDIPASEKMVLLALCNYADEEGVAYPSVPTIAAKANLSERQTRRLLNQLQDDGYVAVIGRKKIYGRWVNLYRVDPTPPPDNMTGREDAPPDTHVRHDRSRVSPKPSVNRQQIPSVSGTELFEAIFETWTGTKYPAVITNTERGRINQAVKEAREAGISPGEWRERGMTYRRLFPGMPVSPQAMLRNWSLLDTPEAAAREPVDPATCEHKVYADLGEVWICVACRKEIFRGEDNE